MSPIQDINSVTLLARLVRDPEMRTIPSTGMSVANLRVAWNNSRKNGATGAWEDKGCFVNVTVFGGQAEACGKVLTKGRQVAVKGRLDFREWEQEGQKRSEVSIVAEQVQFIGDRDRDSAPASSPVQAQSNPVNAPAEDDCPF